MARSIKTIPGIRQKDDKWWVETSYKGNRFHRSFPTKECAEAFLQKMKVEIIEGKFLDKVKPCKVLLGDLAERYLAYCKTQNQKSIYDKGKNIDRLVRYFGARTLIDKITVAKVQEYQEHRTQNPERRKTIGVYAANREVACLKAMFNWAVDRNEIRDNPISRARLLGGETRSEQFFTVEEINKLISCCSNTQMKSIISLAVHTGMRLNELLSLRWKQVKLDSPNPYIELPDQKNGSSAPQELTQGAISILKNLPRNQESPFLFPSPKDPNKHFKEIRISWHKALQAAGLEQKKFHSLRHTTATILAARGAPEIEISNHLRHKSEATTKIYKHLMPGYQNRAISILDAAIPLNQESAQKGD